MSYENEPKSVEDYKDVVKILKLKIIKQNKKIQELELKNKHYEQQINSVTLRGQDLQISSRVMLQLQNQANSKKEQRQLELNTLKGKVEVMNIYVKGLKKLGITPQSVFRMADVGYKSFVESDYFRELLSRLKLGLSQKQISCLIFIFDEAYSGFITRQEYYSSLHAYKLGIQDDYHLYIHECTFKLSQMMHQDKINLIKFYEEMQGRSKSKVGATSKKMVDMNVYEEQIKKCYGSKISEKEIVASFHAIDLQSQGYLEKSNFLYTITSFINKLLTGQDVTKKTQNEWSNVRSQITEPFQGSPTKKGDKVIENFNASSKVVSQVNEGFIHSQGSVNRLKKQFGVSISRLYEQIALYDFTHRLTLKAFKKLCWKVNEKLSSEFLSELYRQMDNQLKGSIYFNQLLNYYVSNSTDYEMILRLFGKYLAVNDLNSEKFWFMFGLNPESEVSKNKFEEIMKKTFESKDEKVWEPLWNSFSRDRDSCNVGVIIKAFQKYES